MFFSYDVTRESGKVITVITDYDPTDVIFDAVDVKTIGEANVEV